MPEPDENELVHRGYKLVAEGFAQAEALNAAAAAHFQVALRYQRFVRLGIWLNAVWTLYNLSLSIHHFYRHTHAPVTSVERFISGEVSNNLQPSRKSGY